MKRRRLIPLLAVAALLPAKGKSTVRGRLTPQAGGRVFIRTADGRMVLLDGDAESLGVARDARLHQEDFEAAGEWDGESRFVIDPIHERALFVHRQGKRLVVTYWCAVCAIRSWTPGKCACCQEETDVDLRDPALSDTDPSPG